MIFWIVEITIEKYLDKEIEVEETFFESQFRVPTYLFSVDI